MVILGLTQLCCVGALAAACGPVLCNALRMSSPKKAPFEQSKAAVSHVCTGALLPGRFLADICTAKSQ